MVAYDTTNTAIHLKDTTVIKIIDNNHKDILTNIFPYLIGFLGVGASFYTIQRTIKHQREMKQADIDVATKRKFIDDMILVSNKMTKSFNLFLKITFDFSAYKSSYINIDKEIKDIKNNPDKYNSDTISNKEYLLNIRSEKIDTLEDKINNFMKEFYNNITSIDLYISKESHEYNDIKKLNSNFQKSFKNYVKCFNTDTEDEKTPHIDNKVLLEKFTDDYKKLRVKIQYLIDLERKNIANIILKKSENHKEIDKSQKS